MLEKAVLRLYKSATKGFFMQFYIGLGLQLMGLTSVGLCFFSGMVKGDYGKLELIQLLAGSVIFYIGRGIQGKGGK